MGLMAESFKKLRESKSNKSQYDNKEKALRGQPRAQEPRREGRTGRTPRGVLHKHCVTVGWYEKILF